jgi:glycine cleavage system H protein
VNQAPYGKGWLFKIRLADRAELDKLLARDAYAKSAGV